MASLLTTHVAAQGGAQNGHEVALARALFEEGVALADRGDWSAAADRFERAYALKPTAGIAFNWASALSAVGKLTQASELLEGVLRDAKATPELKQDSQRKLAEIAPRRALLKLHVDASIQSSSVIRIDGNVWPPAVWDVAIPVDPGMHVATAHVGQKELARAEIALGESDSGELTLRLPEQTHSLQTSEASGAEQTFSRDTKKPLYKSWVLWSCVGAVLVGGAVAAAVLASRSGGSASEAPIMGNAGAGIIQW